MTYPTRRELTAVHWDSRWDEIQTPPDGGVLFSSTHSEVVEYSLRGLAAFEHRGDHQVRAAHHVAAGEHLCVGCLKRRLAPGRHAHPAVGMQTDVVAIEPLRRARQEAERDDHGIG